MDYYCQSNQPADPRGSRPIQARRPGRPKAAANTDLIEALTERQDAWAGRSARRLAEIRPDHRADADVRRGWQTECARIGGVFARVPAEWVPGLRTAATAGVAAVEHVLAERTRELLWTLADLEPEQSPPVAAPPRRRAPRLAPSASLARARARAARYSARLTVGRERINTGELRPVEAIERALAGRVGATRTLVLSWPVTLADRVTRAATLGDDAAILGQLETACAAVMTELAPPPRRPAHRSRRQPGRRSRCRALTVPRGGTTPAGARAWPGCRDSVAIRRGLNSRGRTLLPAARLGGCRSPSVNGFE